MSLLLMSDSSTNNNREIILKKLLNKLKKQDYSDQKEEDLLGEVVEVILRSRTVCRRYKGESLFGVYQEIYDEVKIQLTEDVQRAIKKYSVEKLSTIAEQTKAQVQAFKIVLDDSKLKQLAITAQSYAPSTELRTYALDELIKAIELSGRLCHPHKYRFPAGIYSFIYEEALIETFAYVYTRIDNYDPERGNKKFMNWVNFKLDKAVLFCYEQFIDSRINYLGDEPNWDRFPAPSSAPYLADSVYEYIKKDPQGIFRKTFVQGNIKANFRVIALSRIEGKSWQDLSKEFGVSVPTLSGFYQRNCKRFKALLEEEL